jgi:hypothetical protein
MKTLLKAVLWVLSGVALLAVAVVVLHAMGMGMWLKNFTGGRRSEFRADPPRTSAAPVAPKPAQPLTSFGKPETNEAPTR